MRHTLCYCDCFCWNFLHHGDLILTIRIVVLGRDSAFFLLPSLRFPVGHFLLAVVISGYILVTTKCPVVDGMVLCHLSRWTCHTDWADDGNLLGVASFINSLYRAPANPGVVVNSIVLWVGRVGRRSWRGFRCDRVPRPSPTVRRILMKMIHSCLFCSRFTCPFFNRKFTLGCLLWLISGHWSSGQDCL